MESMPYIITVTNKGDKIENVTLFHAEFAPFYKINSENIEIHLEDGGDMEVSCYDDLLKIVNERNLSINKVAIKVSNHEQIVEEIKLKDYCVTGASISYADPLFEKDSLTEDEIDAGYRETITPFGVTDGMTFYGGTAIEYNQHPGTDVKFYFYPCRTPYALTVSNHGDKAEKVTLFTAETALYCSNFGNSSSIAFGLSRHAGQHTVINSYKELLLRTIAQTFGINKIIIQSINHNQLLEKYSITDYPPTGSGQVELPPLFQKESLTDVEIKNDQIKTDREIVIYGGTAILYHTTLW